MKYEKGQMAQLNYEIDGTRSWEYLVCVDSFDNKTLFLQEYGGRFMLTQVEGATGTELNKRDVEIQPLLRDGQPVFSKRSFFGLGRYTFEPTTKG